MTQTQHDSDQPDLHRTIVDFLAGRLPGLGAVYLFGSRAAGQEAAGSDLDVAVLPPRALGAQQRYDLAAELADRIGYDVDLIDLRDASAVLRSQVIGHGRALYVAPSPEVEAFLDLVFSDYARLNEERAEILRDVEARGSIHG